MELMTAPEVEAVVRAWLARMDDALGTWYLSPHGSGHVTFTVGPYQANGPAAHVATWRTIADTAAARLYGYASLPVNDPTRHMLSRLLVTSDPHTVAAWASDHLTDDTAPSGFPVDTTGIAVDAVDWSVVRHHMDRTIRIGYMSRLHCDLPGIAAAAARAMAEYRDTDRSPHKEDQTAKRAGAAQDLLRLLVGMASDALQSVELTAPAPARTRRRC